MFILLNKHTKKNYIRKLFLCLRLDTCANAFNKTFFLLFFTNFCIFKLGNIWLLTVGAAQRGILSSKL